ncbi:unnamed protein product, partial [Polarella glacialis]
VGCFNDASAPFDCQADFDSYQDSWSKTKQAWCCWKESRGCSDELSQQDEVASTTPKPQNYDNIIDCQAGIWDVEHLWDCEKQAFCCAEQGMGCPDNAFDCNSGYINWVHGWSKGKQIWCCARTGMGCPPTTMTATSTSTATVTETTPACQFTCLQQGVAVACGERVHYAAIHIFLGQPNACGSAHELVLNECKAACESCSVIEACYGAADIETSTLPPTLPPPTSTIAPPFDCHEGLEQWQFTWFRQRMERLADFFASVDWQKAGLLVGNYVATTATSWTLRTSCPVASVCPSLTCGAFPTTPVCPEVLCGSCVCEAVPVGLAVPLIAFLVGVIFGVIVIGGWFGTLLLRPVTRVVGRISRFAKTTPTALVNAAFVAPAATPTTVTVGALLLFRMAALDVSVGQVLIDFFNDAAGFYWHGRLLLVRLAAPGHWIVATPDLDVQVANLTAHRVIPLIRSTPIPARFAGEVYFFDPIPANALADVMGVAAVPGATVTDAIVVVADPAHERFGGTVDDAIVADPLRALFRDAVGLVQIEDDHGGLMWVHAERLRPADLAAWRSLKQHGPGRDARLGGPRPLVHGRRFVDLKVALGSMSEVSEVLWVFKGPRVISELLATIRGTGDDFLNYHDVFVRSSGLHPDSAIAHSHRALLSIIFHLVCYDFLNVFNIAGAEMAARHVIYIQKAVRRSPKNPDFRGLEIMIQSDLDTSGNLLGGAFGKFVAEEQKSEAFTLKQQRLFSDELAAMPPAPGIEGESAVAEPSLF